MNDDIIDVVRRIQNAGIYIIGNYIFGLPEETKESLELDLPTLEGAWLTNLEVRSECDWEELKGRAVVDEKNDG